MVWIEEQRLSEEILSGLQLPPGFADHAEQGIDIGILGALRKQTLADGGCGFQFTPVGQLSRLPNADRGWVSLGGFQRLIGIRRRNPPWFSRLMNCGYGLGRNPGTPKDAL